MEAYKHSRGLDTIGQWPVSGNQATCLRSDITSCSVLVQTLLTVRRPSPPGPLLDRALQVAASLKLEPTLQLDQVQVDFTGLLGPNDNMNLAPRMPIVQGRLCMHAIVPKLMLWDQFN